MKLPKNVKRYCPKCKKHTEHKVAQSKKKTQGTAHPLSFGGKIRRKRRGVGRGYGNRGRESRGAASGWKMFNKKTSKKTDLRYTCKVCNKSHGQRKGFRTKKIEFV